MMTYEKHDFATHFRTALNEYLAITIPEGYHPGGTRFEDHRFCCATPPLTINAPLGHTMWIWIPEGYWNVLPNPAQQIKPEDWAGILRVLSKGFLPNTTFLVRNEHRLGKTPDQWMKHP